MIFGFGYDHINLQAIGTRAERTVMAWAAKRAGGYIGRYRDAEGKVQSTHDGLFTTKKAARLAAQRQEQKVDDGTWINEARAESTTFALYFENRWITERTLEVNGRATYWSHYRSKKFGLKSYFGAMPLSKLRYSPVIQEYVNQMQAAGVTARTIKARVDTLHVVLFAKKGVSARTDGLMDIDACALVTVPTVPQREVQIYLPDQVDALIEALPTWWRLMVWIDSETGLRWGELIGLRVCDVDFLRRRISVNHTIIEASKELIGNGTRFAWKQYVKDKDIRSAGLSQETVDMLSVHVSARSLSGEDLLFAMPTLRRLASGKHEQVDEVDRRNEKWPGGLPVSRAHFRAVWNTSVAAAGVPPRRRHDLRASFASWLLDDPQLAPQHVMDILGHGRWDTTKRYKKSLDRHQELGVAAIESVRRRYRTS